MDLPGGIMRDIHRSIAACASWSRKVLSPSFLLFVLPQLRHKGHEGCA